MVHNRALVRVLKKHRGWKVNIGPYVGKIKDIHDTFVVLEGNSSLYPIPISLDEISYIRPLAKGPGLPDARTKEPKRKGSHRKIKIKIDGQRQKVELKTGDRVKSLFAEAGGYNGTVIEIDDSSNTVIVKYDSKSGHMWVYKDKDIRRCLRLLEDNEEITTNPWIPSPKVKVEKEEEEIPEIWGNRVLIKV